LIGLRLQTLVCTPKNTQLLINETQEVKKKKAYTRKNARIKDKSKRKWYYRYYIK